MDYLAFRRVYHNDLLHYGIKRRSGRYPWGSGKNPYQSDAKRAIDKAVRRTDKRNDPRSIALNGSVYSRISNNVKDTHNMFGEKSDSIKKMHDELNSKIYQAENSAIHETKKLSSDPSFRRELDRHMEKNIYDKATGLNDFIYDKIIMNEDNRHKYFPETDKIIKQLDIDQEKYKETIRGEIKNILDKTRDISSKQISQIKTEQLTYGDIINRILAQKISMDWAQRGDSNLQNVVYEELKKIYR